MSLQNMEQEINNLKITMAELKSDIAYIKDSVKQNLTDHKEILSKIDHLGDTFQGKIQDKADQKEVMARFTNVEVDYVRLETFKPIQKIVYGIVGAFGLAIVAAVWELIIM